MLDNFEKKALAALKNVDSLPDEFKSWLWQAISRSPNVSISKQQIPNVLGEAWRNVGATGQPVFQNSWVNYGAGYVVARFYKDYLGIVHVEGLVKLGAPGTIFTLPAGYRPDSIIVYVTEGNDAIATFEVRGSGDVAYRSGATGYFSINCTFRAA